MKKYIAYVYAAVVVMAALFLMWSAPVRAAENTEIPGPKPLKNVKDPFFDWEGTTLDFRIVDTKKAYYWDHEFCTRFLRNGDKNDEWKVISRYATPYNGAWRFGPTYLPLKVDWSVPQNIRVVGVKKIDRIPAAFHGEKLPEGRTVTVFILWVKQDGKWKEWYVNNWLHPYRHNRKELACETVEIAQYYIDKGPPYNVFGWLSGTTDKIYPPILKKLITEKRSEIYGGFLVSDTNYPQGFRLDLRHLWVTKNYGLREKPYYGNMDELDYFRLPHKKWP